jgi:hypothetical protein
MLTNRSIDQLWGSAASWIWIATTPAGRPATSRSRDDGTGRTWSLRQRRRRRRQRGSICGRRAGVALHHPEKRVKRRAVMKYYSRRSNVVGLQKVGAGETRLTATGRERAHSHCSSTSSVVLPAWSWMDRRGEGSELKEPRRRRRSRLYDLDLLHGFRLLGWCYIARWRWRPAAQVDRGSKWKMTSMSDRVRSCRLPAFVGEGDSSDIYSDGNLRTGSELHLPLYFRDRITFTVWNRISNPACTSDTSGFHRSS